MMQCSWEGGKLGCFGLIFHTGLSSANYGSFYVDGNLVGTNLVDQVGTKYPIKRHVWGDEERVMTSCSRDVMKNGSIGDGDLRGVV